MKTGLRSRVRIHFVRWAVASTMVATFALTFALTPAPSARADNAGGAVPGSPRGAAGAVAVGDGHVCALLADQQITCWGSDFYGTLGNGPASTGTVTGPHLAIALPNGARARALAAGEQFQCALLEDGQVTCWGGDADGALGNGSYPGVDAPPSPVTLPSGRSANAISAGAKHMCALLDNGQVTCWGRDADGQLGNGVAEAQASPPPSIALPAGRTATAIAAGSDHTCALLDNGQISCWGRDDLGQLGNGATTGDIEAPPSPVVLPENRSALAITGGQSHTCAILDNLQVACWGDDTFGQLGNGAADATATPELIDLDSVQSIAAGRFHTCAVDTVGLTYCWGRGLFRATGLGVDDDTPAPSLVVLPGNQNARAIAAGGHTSCAVMVTGRLACWGRNTSGEVGTGGVPSDYVATPYGPIIGDLTVLSTNPASVDPAITHSCAVMLAGQVTCWGSGFQNKLGRGDTANHPTPPPPLAMPGGRAAVGVATGDSHSCALLAGGSVSCWGYNFYGQAGTGSLDSYVATPSAPISLPNGRAATRISAGASHTCAVLDDGGVACWGRDSVGQVGDGTPSVDAIRTPARVTLPAGRYATEVVASGGFTCALLDNGTVSCWGIDNAGQLGNGDGTDLPQLSPGTPLTMPEGFATAITAGNSHVCAILSTTRLTCWGSDSDGQLGNGDGVSGPQTAPGGTALTFPDGPVLQVAAGGSHTCTLVLSGGSGGTPMAACWGNDMNGQLGNGAGDSSDKHAPNSATGPYLGVATGSVSTCLIDRWRALQCFGSNNGGTLGNGDPDNVHDLSAPPTALRGDVVIAWPPALPTAPTAVVPTGGVNSASVTWAVPPDDGGAPVQYFVVEASNDGGASWSITESTAGAETSLAFAALASSDYRFRVAAVNSVGRGLWSTISAPTSVTNPSGGGGGGAPAVVNPVEPARYWDTRPEQTFDGEFRATGRMAGGSTFAIQIAGRGSVPSGSAGVVANLTVIFADGPGFATLFPCTPTPPQASHLNYYPGQVLANNAIVPLDPTGKVCVYTLGGADFALDVNGYVPAGSPAGLITPTRYLDTRAEATFDGESQGGGRVAAGAVVEVQIAGRGAIPADAKTAIVNATAVFPDDPGFLTLYPCGPLPTTSTVNYFGGQVVPNGAVIELSPTGSLCIYTLAGSDIVLDVAGYVPASATRLTTRTPARLADTRPGEALIDGPSTSAGRVAAGTHIEVQVTGRADVPAGATAALLNLVAVYPGQPGFATLYPCGPLPNASNVNYAQAGLVVANNAVVKLSPTGTICIHTLAEADYVLDITGWTT
jgi:alpha-tubulin suppressor-like RCC1 family protein